MHSEFFILAPRSTFDRILDALIYEFKRLTVIDSSKKSVCNISSSLQLVAMLLKTLPVIHFMRNTKVQSGVYSVIDDELENIKPVLAKTSTEYVYTCDLIV